MTSNQPPAEVIQAFYQPMELNLTSHQPKVEAWLHSEDANPVLKQLLINVPCARLMHYARNKSGTFFIMYSPR
jgi:hypothetical protein